LKKQKFTAEIQNCETDMLGFDKVEIIKQIKGQKFPPLKPLPFCLLFEENKEF